MSVLGAGQTTSYDGCTYTVNKNRTLTFTYAPYTVTKLVVPAKIKISGNAYKVVKIGPSAASGRTQITKLVVGKNVKSIGKSAFENCTALKKVTIKSKKIKKVGKGAFATAAPGLRVKCPKGKVKAYKKKLRKSGLPSKAKVK